jgi:hypothetical protein
VSNLLFFTYADRKYEIFAIPYTWFALKNNPDSIVEITLEDYEGFINRYAAGISILKKNFEGRFYFSQSLFSGKGIVPNSIRFLDTPSVECNFVYIGDIDLLVFDDVYRIHSNLIITHNLPFSNIIRNNNTHKPRLTGLHFCKFDKFYPAPDLSDIDLLSENDEHILYLYMSRKGYMVSPDFKKRPECGIHISLNRDPQGRTSGPNAGVFVCDAGLGWGGSTYYDAFLTQIKDINFLELLSGLDIEFKFILLTLEAIATGYFNNLHWLALNHLLDKRLISSKKQYSIPEFNHDRDKLIERKRFDDAESLNKIACTLWPNNIEILGKMSWILMSNGKDLESTLVLERITNLPSGKEFIKKLGFIEKNINRIKKQGLDGVTLLKKLDLG